jgi:hypothetical protein
MISAWQIVIAGLLTGIGIGVAVRAVGWEWPTTAMASALGCLLVIGWRAVANVLWLNDDFLPAVSLGDLACFPIGAIGPAIMSVVASRPASRRWFPAFAGGLVAFVVNVVVL